MNNLFNMLILALDFCPGYKRKTGAVILAAGAAAVAYNNTIAPTFGLPVVPADVVVAAQTAGSAILGVGVAAAAVR